MQERVQQKTPQLKAQKANSPKKPNRVREKLSGQKVATIASIAVLVLAHVAILLAIIWSWRYYPIYPSLFGSAVGIIICAMIIIDIIFFVGFNHKDLFLKIVSTVMAVLLLIGGTVGSVAISKANSIVNGVLDDGKDNKYETFSGVFVYYKGNKGANNFTGLADLSGKKVGMLTETTNGLSYIATNLLSKEKIDYATVDYKTNAEMMQGLLDGDVDAIVITSAYRTIYKAADETTAEGETAEPAAETGEGEVDATGAVQESPFARYLPDLVDFYSFQEDLKTDVQRSTKNLSTDPFNVLLIGYSRTEIGSTVGLADSIILATINPQTYEVAMTSIARDSFVPISCYGGEYDKINSGRSTSRACFIQTVKDFLNIDIDYYMELDYLGLVQIVNAIGGIVISNPVEFTLDGIYVPAGTFLADGQQALQFCRERHHMSGGDFSRQQHQKEVIIAIAQKFVESGSVSLALHAMEEAADWMSTDMTLSQLTSVFNLLLNTKNFTTMDTFDLVDFQNSRITGNGGLMYYSYSMRLPLWVYLIYQGSYDETMAHINEVMGNYSSYNQNRNHEFSLSNEYEKPQLYSLYYDEVYMYTPDPMPPFWASLTDMSLNSALAWASSNGVSLSVNYINPGDANYDSSLEGMVVSQSPRYGSLISEYGSGSITVMAPNEVDPEKQVPNFVEHSYKKAEEWADEHNIGIKIHFDTDLDGKVGDVVRQEPKPYTSIDEVSTLEVWVKAGTFNIKFDKNGYGKESDVPNTLKVTTGDKSVSFTSGDYLMSNVEKDGDTYAFQGWYKTKDHTGEQITSSSQVSGDTTLYAYWKNISHVHQYDDNGWTNVSGGAATCEHGTYQERYCKYCNEPDSRQTRELDDKKDHTPGEWETTDAATCEHGTYQQRKCTVCGKVLETRELDDKKDHTPGEWANVDGGAATCEHGTYQEKRCTVCGKVLDTRELDDILTGDACVVYVTCPDGSQATSLDACPAESGTGDGNGNSTGDGN